MVDKEQIWKIAQENNLEYEFVELYVEEIEKIFQKHFCFTEKEVQKNISKIFETKSQEAVEYFFNVFHNFSLLNSSSKQLNDTEKFYRKKFAQDVVEKAFELYTIQSRKIKDEFFNALKEAEKFGIDPYRISNKTTFKNLSKSSFLESLKALMEDTYVDTNTMKEFHLFEKSEDVKGMFEECSSLACKFNFDSIQNVLELLSNFTFDKKNNMFYGNVNYVNMVRKCKKILTQPTSKLQETMDFLTKYFTDQNDATTKQDLVLKVNQDPTILLLSPNKVFSLEKELISVGLSQEKAKSFCFNKNNLIQINGISKENISDLHTLKNVLQQYLDEESTFDALTRFEFIKTKPIVLDIIFKRAIEEGVYSNLLKKPSALSMIVGDEANSNPKTKEHNLENKEKRGSFKALEERKSLSDEEKDVLQKQLSRISAKDKEYIDGVIEKLKGKETSGPRIGGDFGKGGNGEHSSSSGKHKRKSKYLTDELLASVESINAKDNLSDLMKVLSICELCLDNIKGKGYCKKQYCTDEVKKVIERMHQIDSSTENLIDNDFLQPFDDIINHLSHIAHDKIPEFLANTREIREYVLSRSFEIALKSAKKFSEQIEKLSSMGVKVKNNIYNIYMAQCESMPLKKQKSSQSNPNPLVKTMISSIYCNEAHNKMIVFDMVSELHKILKTNIEDVLDEERLTKLSSATYNPKTAIVLFNYLKKVVELNKFEEEAFNGTKTFNDRPLINNMFHDIFTDQTIKREMLVLCFAVMTDRKTKQTVINKGISADIFDLANIEYDDKGIYFRFKKGYTFFYPGTYDKAEIEKLKLEPATEGTKALPKVTMTNDKIIEDIKEFERHLS